MKTKTILRLGSVIIPWVAGCAAEPVKLFLVGPVPESCAATVADGRLKVFTDTKTHVIAENLYYYPHTGYRILDEAGRLVKYVPNHLGSMDESPTLVTIPSGNYNVVALASSYGRVTVPVLIESGRTTVVHLDRSCWSSSKVPANELVYLPDKEVVGWRGPLEKKSE